MIYGILFYQAEKQIKHHILTINWILILKNSTHWYFIASSSNCYINCIESLWNINVLVDHQFNWYIINIFIVYLSYIIYKHFLYYVVNVYIDLCLYSRAYTIDMYSQRIICPNAACLITFIHIILNYLKKYKMKYLHCCWKSFPGETAMPLLFCMSIPGCTLPPQHWLKPTQWAFTWLPRNTT